MTRKYAWGNDVYMSFQTSKGAVGASGELVPNGSQLLLKDVAIYPEGADRLNIGFSQVAQIQDAVAAGAELRPNQSEALVSTSGQNSRSCHNYENYDNYD